MVRALGASTADSGRWELGRVQGRPQHASGPVPSGCAGEQSPEEELPSSLRVTESRTPKFRFQVCFPFPGTAGLQTWVQGRVPKTLTASLRRKR